MIFSMDAFGVHTPCRLLCRDTEYVRFEGGLHSNPIFNQQFRSFVTTMNYSGIPFQGKTVRIGDDEFGSAFYTSFFPKMCMSNPELYRWEVL